MSEEENGLPEGAGTPAEPTPPEGGTPEPEPVNWEKRYKDLQVESTRASQEAADLRKRVEQLEQPPEEEPSDDDYGGENTFTDRKTVSTMINAAVLEERKANRMERANAYFRRTYPDLVKHENVIGGIIRNPKDPQSLKGASAEERIDAAVKEFNKLTEEAVNTATAQADAEAKQREEKNRKATGLGDGSTPPSKSDTEGESDADELKRRKAQSAKRRGLA